TADVDARIRQLFVALLLDRPQAGGADPRAIRDLFEGDVARLAQLPQQRAGEDRVLAELGGDRCTARARRLGEAGGRDLLVARAVLVDARVRRGRSRPLAGRWARARAARPRARRRPLRGLEEGQLGLFGLLGLLDLFGERGDRFRADRLARRRQRGR